MASFVSASCELARLSSRSLHRYGAHRGFKQYARCMAAQNFTMPAMSPTMTEGNIANWKLKEGDSFSTGDVLLEIETDKAQMDVEAQDDGKMAKIIHPQGSKGIKVGTRIAVIAEPEDDLNSLSLPVEDTEPSQATSPQDETQSGIDPSKSSESQAESPPSSKGEDTSSSAGTPSPSTSPKQSSANPPAKLSKQVYPLYPSINQILREKGVPASEVDKIPASGPKGRLLKGDVLAYLGTISKSYSSDQSSRISKLGHLDISNVKAAPVEKKSVSPPCPAPSKTHILETEPDTEVAVTISLASVLEVQQRIQRTLRIKLPVSTFIERAIEIANESLPRSKGAKPTTDELFNQILGLDKVHSKTSTGSFMPQITALPSTPTSVVAAPSKSVKAPDIIDLLISQSSTTSPKGLPTPHPDIIAGSVHGASTNLFSVSAPKSEEKRAKIFLERIKTILQVEPGRLVL